MKVPPDTALTLAITNPVLRPWIKQPTADALANQFGCNDGTKDVDPTVSQILQLTDKQIIDAQALGTAAVKQVHALREAING